MNWTNLINYFGTINCRIEIEGKKSSLKREGITDFSLNYVRAFTESANKRGVEYRIYFNGDVPAAYINYQRNNVFYNTDRFEHVINNKELAKNMLGSGFNFGDN